MLPLSRPDRIGYVVKVYPRFSETFIVNEVLAHERAGAELEIFSLRPPVSGRFHELLGRVRASTTYIPAGGLKADGLWHDLHEAGREVPHLWEVAVEASNDDARDVHQAALLAREALRRRVTHLHAHFASVSATVARLAARMAGLTYSVTAHAKDIFHEEVNEDHLRRKLADAAAVITVSDFNVTYLRRLCPEAGERVHRVYNGLDLERFPWSDPRERPPRIVAVGRLVEKKGFADLVEACAILARRGVPFECEIVGDGPEEPDLRARIARHGLEERVRLLGPRTQVEVLRIVASSAAFAAPCVIGADGNRDGLPTVLLEAMALGAPCVSTDVTGIPEVLHDGATGLMAPQHDPGRLADALRRLLADGALRSRLARAARSLIVEEFDVDGNAARIRALLGAGEAIVAQPAARLTDTNGPQTRDPDAARGVDPDDALVAASGGAQSDGPDRAGPRAIVEPA